MCLKHRGFEISLKFIYVQYIRILRKIKENIGRFVHYYNAHESLDNLTPADVYFGKKKELLSLRAMIKHETLKMRRLYNLGNESLKKQLQILKSTP